MNTKATEENILKYFKILKELKLILDNTPYLSMFGFCTRHKVSKSLSTALTRGGVVKCIKKGKHSQWKWLSIEPTREMAIKTLKELSRLNPPRKPVVKKPVSVFDNQFKKPIKYYKISMFFGLINLKIEPIFNK